MDSTSDRDFDISFNDHSIFGFFLIFPGPSKSNSGMSDRFSVYVFWSCFAECGLRRIWILYVICFGTGCIGHCSCWRELMDVGDVGETSAGVKFDGGRICVGQCGSWLCGGDALLIQAHRNSQFSATAINWFYKSLAHPPHYFLFWCFLIPVFPIVQPNPSPFHADAFPYPNPQ